MKGSVEGIEGGWVFPRLVRAFDEYTSSGVSTARNRAGGLDVQDERDLRLNVVKHNCTLSRSVLARAHHFLVEEIAGELVGRGLSQAELASHGCEGLQQAIDTFDPSRGLRFRTYAAWWVRRAMEQALDGNGRASA